MDICPTSKLQELLLEIGQIEIGVGTLQATNSRLAEAIEPSINELRQWATTDLSKSNTPCFGISVGETRIVALERAQVVKTTVFAGVKQQPHIHVDESPWPVLGLKEWMWVLAGEQFCLFHAGDTRSRGELVAQLGESFPGVLVPCLL